MMFSENYERSKMRAEEATENALVLLKRITASTSFAELNRLGKTEREVLLDAHKEILKAKIRIEEALSISKPADG